MPEPVAPTKRAPAHYLWAVLIARIYEVFPLLCPLCGGQMCLIAFITEGTQIRRILDHIGVDSEAPHISPARGPPLWDACDAQVDDRGQSEPADWDLAAQAAPDYEVDQRILAVDRSGSALLQMRVSTWVEGSSTGRHLASFAAISAAIVIKRLRAVGCQEMTYEIHTLLRANEMKSYKRIAIGALLIAAAAGVTSCAVSPRIATTTVSAVANRSATIPFELYRGNRILLKGHINGVETTMILDSGAGVTTLDKQFAHDNGLTNGQKVSALGTGGEQDAELFQNVTIEAGNLKLSGATVVAIDLGQITKGIGRPIPVILGRELFMSSVVAIDFERNEISLSPSKGFLAPARAKEVELKRDGTLHYMPISLAGLPPVEAALDLGNGSALSISKEYHEAHPKFAALSHAVSLGGGVGGLREIKLVTVPTVDMAGFEFSSVPANLGALAGGPYEGRANVGIQMLRPFKITLDLGNDRLWLQRNDQPAEFSRDRTGMFVLLEGDHFNVLHVSPGGPADRAGLQKGDKLVAISGVRVGPGFFSGPQRNWAQGAPGADAAATKSDGTTVKLTLADYY